MVHRALVLALVHTYRSSRAGPAACGPDVEVGERIGVMAAPGSELTMCVTTEPSALERLAQPLPDPDGVGRAAFLVGGAFNADGVVGARRPRADPALRALHRSAAATCPGGRTVVGVDGRAITVMRVRDLGVLRRLGAGGAGHVRCLDATGRRVVGVAATMATQ